MALSPEDIENRQFVIALRGYDKDEVDAFLHEVAETLRGTGASAGDGASDDGGPDRFANLGDEIAAIARSAAERAEQVTADAEREAADVVARARVEADELRDTARAEVARETEAIQAELERMRREREQIGAEIETLRADAEAARRDLDDARRQASETRAAAAEQLEAETRSVRDRVNAAVSGAVDRIPALQGTKDELAGRLDAAVDRWADAEAGLRAAFGAAVRDTATALDEARRELDRVLSEALGMADELIRSRDEVVNEIDRLTESEPVGASSDDAAS